MLCRAMSRDFQVDSPQFYKTVSLKALGRCWITNGNKMPTKIINIHRRRRILLFGSGLTASDSYKNGMRSYLWSAHKLGARDAFKVRHFPHIFFGYLRLPLSWNFVILTVDRATHSFMVLIK